MASVSLAVMVRDDAARLSRCIESARQFVQEVVVLDTGSQDDTVAVARSAGADVHEIAWPNNFSTALNLLLDKIRTDWVLRLDSDEWFEREAMGEAADHIEDSEACAYWLTRRDIQPHGGIEEISLIRLWRCHPALRYQGVVHENIPLARFKDAWPELRINPSPIWFWHDGYGAGHLDKIRRNVHLMEDEVRLHPESIYYRAMLTKGYLDLGDDRGPHLMEAIVKESLSQTEPATPVLGLIFAEYFQRVQGPALKSEVTVQAIQKAVRWFESSPQVMVALSNLELRRGDKRAALDILLKMEVMADTGNYDRSLPVSPSLFGKAFWKHLDRLADQLGRYDVCKRCEPHL